MNDDDELNEDNTPEGPEGVDVTSLFDDDPDNDPEILGEETLDTDTEHEFSAQDGKEVNLDTGEEGHSNGDIESAYWSDSDDAQDLKDELDHDYSNAYTGTWHVNEDGKRDYDHDVLHNAGVAVERGGSSVANKVKEGLNSLNRTLGGTSSLGYTNADLERNREARNAKETYREIADRQKTALEEFGKKYDPNNKEDVAKYNELKAQYEETERRSAGIDAGLHSTDTGSRLGNMWENAKEDIGDVGTRINQFFGGSNEYGLGAHGQVNDRNGDGKTSIKERLLNMGRDIRDWAADKVENASVSSLVNASLGTMGPLGWFAAPIATAGINKGIDAISEYAKNHPYNMTSAEKEAYEKEQQALAEAGYGDSDAEDFSQPAGPTNVSIERTPTPSFGDWDTKALQNMSTSGRTYGWNKTNDVMGHSTSALSDACFKDFLVASMMDNKVMHDVIKSKLMLEYFK